MGSEPQMTQGVPESATGIDAGLVADCVHCGFCLPSCPTYLLWGEEMDSPRGRIYLMKQRLEGEPLDDAMVRHFDQCLGCMACVTACPSGVRYDRLIEATRAHVEETHERSPSDRALRSLVFHLFPYPRRLRAMRPLLRAYQRSGAARLVGRSRLLDRLPPTVGAMERLMPPVGREREEVAESTPAQGARRARVGMLLGCVQREFFPGVNAATARVLSAEGCEVVAPALQGCCGALSLHSGRHDEAVRFAKRTITTFESLQVDAVVVNAAGCGSSMKDYAEVLADEPGWAERAAAFAAKVRDVTELLADLGPVAPRHPLPLTAAYHDACHLSHAQGVRIQPRELLAGIPDLQLREIAEADICCGSAGVYNLFQPDAARALGDRKAAHVLDTGADVLVTANPGCLLQIHAAAERAGRTVALAHTVQVLDASIRGVALAEAL
ncbi:MAG TPA: heterodisulfide reductase-related iron-sulfur binding cluster [Mycobacteriales bacterium]|nr:heterodisulfide reductase-related iron-sulfur binding cluster [Mycobacteriales bacterium]